MRSLGSTIKKAPSTPPRPPSYGKKGGFYHRFFPNFRPHKPRFRKFDKRLLFKQILGTLGVLSLSGILLFFLSDLPQKWANDATEWAVEKAQKSGFRIQEIVLAGRNRASREEILEALNLELEDPIFRDSPETLRQKVKTVTWVKDAQVQRWLPDRIFIRIKERTPLAIWQHKKKHVLVDQEGVVLSKTISAEYKHLPIVLGAEAPKYVSKILALLQKKPKILARVTALIWVGKRRWNLQLDRHIDVKLPEKDIEVALSRLQKLLDQPNLAWNDIKAIDLRLSHLTVLRMNGPLNGKGVET